MNISAIIIWVIFIAVACYILKAFGWLIVPVAVFLLVKYYGWVMTFCAGVAVFYIGGLIHLVVVHTKKKKIQRLLHKYNNDEAVVQGIMNHTFWIGQTEEQLLDSIGNPVDVSSWASSKSSGETWKYNQTGKNRYNLKISLCDGEVVNWDQK